MLNSTTSWQRPSESGMCLEPELNTSTSNVADCEMGIVMVPAFSHWFPFRLSSTPARHIKNHEKGWVHFSRASWVTFNSIEQCALSNNPQCRFCHCKTNCCGLVLRCTSTHDGAIHNPTADRERAAGHDLFLNASGSWMKVYFTSIAQPHKYTPFERLVAKQKSNGPVSPVRTFRSMAQSKSTLAYQCYLPRIA